jgi:hypothetical protein
MRIALFAAALACAVVMSCELLYAQGQSVSELVKMYEKGDFASQTNAVKNLAQHQDPNGPLYLGRVFRSQKDVVIRVYIIEQLVEAGSDAAGEALLECAGDKEEQVIAAYRKGLVAFSKKPGFTNMVKIAITKKKGAQYAEVRKFIAQLLGNIESKTALDVLKKALKDKDWEVRLMAAESLCEIGTEEAVREACRAIEDSRPEVAAAVLDMVAGFEISKYINYLMKGLSSKHATVRAKTLEVLAGQTDSRLLRKFAELVADPDAVVRGAAIIALKWAQSRDVIEDLIKGLRTPVDADKEHIASALKALTSQDFGTDQKKWEEWWEKNSKTAALAQPPQHETGYGKATYFGTTVDSKNVIFIIDISGSMSEKYEKKKDGKTQCGGTTADDPKEKKEEGSPNTVTKIEVAKKELINCIKKLQHDVKFNIVFYNEAYSAWQRKDDGSGSKIIPATPRNKRAAREFILTFTPSGRTNIFDPLEFAMSDKDADTIYLLTDGMPNEGKIRTTEGIIAEIERINAARNPKATINTIGFGLRAEGQSFLKRLAEKNGGVFIDM